MSGNGYNHEEGRRFERVLSIRVASICIGSDLPNYSITTKLTGHTGDYRILVKSGIRAKLLKDLDDKQLAELLAALLYVKLKKEMV
jgi:hypothetical protein